MECYKCGNDMKRYKGEYRYTESGLDTVTLKDIVQYRCACGETMVELKNIKGLHRTIASILTKKKDPLTGKEIRFIRKEMGMRAKDLAEIMGVSPITVSRWENDVEKPEMAKDRFVRLLYIQTVQERHKEVIMGSFNVLRESKGTHYKPLTIKIPTEKRHSSLKVPA